MTDGATEILDWLAIEAREDTRLGLARFGIPNDTAFGVSMAQLKAKAKALGSRHETALNLWETERYEARIMSVYLADPGQMTFATACSWTADFDNWAICDTAAFHLFDRCAFRWSALAPWAEDERAFVRRAAFATLWGLSVHDKGASDALFKQALALVSKHSEDSRPVVKKAVDMSLRAVGKRNAALHAAALELTHDMSASDNKTRAWIGRHARKELEGKKVRSRLGC